MRGERIVERHRHHKFVAEKIRADQPLISGVTLQTRDCNVINLVLQKVRYHFFLNLVYGYRNIWVIRAESRQDIIRDICRGIAEMQRITVLMRSTEFFQQRIVIGNVRLAKL